MFRPAPANAAPLISSDQPDSGPHVVASIVSHGHGDLIMDLVQQLQAHAEPCLRRVIVTLNIEEPELAQQLQQLAHGSFVVDIIHNPMPKGFGSNHNAAFQQYFAHPSSPGATHVCILNPDLRLLDAAPLATLAHALDAAGTGLAYPTLVNSDGQRQDNERELPRLSKLFLRRVFKRQEQRIDWVSGACMMLRAPDWHQLGGFNEQFHMYCEDVDLSLRARRDIGRLVHAPTQLEHRAQRASHRQWRHLAWHLQSLWLLWRLPSFRWALRHPSTALRTPV